MLNFGGLTMKPITKNMIRGAFIALGLTVAGVGAANAGEWRINASRCPDLREDRYDRNHDHGRADRREDRRDERVVNCPARAWYYVPDRAERRGFRAGPPPRQVYIHSDGRHYYRGDRGAMITLRID